MIHDGKQSLVMFMQTTADVSIEHDDESNVKSLVLVIRVNLLSAVSEKVSLQAGVIVSYRQTHVSEKLPSQSKCALILTYLGHETGVGSFHQRYCRSSLASI